MLFSKTKFLTMIEKQNNKGRRAAGEEEQHTNEKTHEAHDRGQAESRKWGQCQTKGKKNSNERQQHSGKRFGEFICLKKIIHCFFNTYKLFMIEGICMMVKEGAKLSTAHGKSTIVARQVVSAFCKIVCQ